MSMVNITLKQYLSYKGAGGKHITVYSRAGSDVTIRCFSWTHSGCGSISWTYQKNHELRHHLVIEGNVQNETKFGDNRLRLETDCALHISYVTADDAGHYKCKDQRAKEEVVDLAVINGKISRYRNPHINPFYYK